VPVAVTVAVTVEQAEQCPRTIGAALAEAGRGFGDVVRVRYLLSERADFEPCRPVLRRCLSQVRPAATMLMCGLADPRMKIEMDARRPAAARASRAAGVPHGVG
jgi:enamine deaminase RidA (YjgF/YER057c/UK114 family)